MHTAIRTQAQRRPAALPIVALIAALTLVFAFLVPTQNEAHAAELEDVITDVQTDGSVAPGDRFRVDITWEVPDSAQPGDTFSMQLPDELLPMKESFEVLDPDGNVIATAEVVDGVVVFTLTDYVADHTDVSGTAYFWLEVSEDAEPGDDVTIEWNLDDSVKIEIEEPGDGDWVNDRDKGQKHGTYYPESGIVEWIVMGPLGYDEVTFVDEAQEGQTFVCDDLRVEIWTLDDKGHWDSSELAENHDVTCTETLVEGTIYDVPDGKIGALIIPTIVPEGVEVVENKATVSVTDQTDEPGAETIVTDAGGEGDGDQIVTPSPTPTPSETPESPEPSETPGSPEPSETPESPAPSESPESPSPSPSETTDAPAPPPEDDNPKSPRLPRTGTSALMTLGLGALLVAGGATALIAARRRA